MRSGPGPRSVSDHGNQSFKMLSALKDSVREGGGGDRQRQRDRERQRQSEGEGGGVGEFTRQTWCLTSTETIRLIRDGEMGER